MSTEMESIRVMGILNSEYTPTRFTYTTSGMKKDEFAQLWIFLSCIFGDSLIWTVAGMRTILNTELSDRG